MKLLKLSLSLAFPIMISLLITSAVSQTDEAAASTAIAEVEAQLASTYESVWVAEDAGGNISSLVDRLNIACEYLANAQRSYREGKFSEAQLFARLATDALKVLESEAVELADQARLEHEQILYMTFGLSALGILFVVLGGFLGWRYVAAYFVQRVLKMKPEVSEDVEHR